ncbi:MAG: glycerol-3-phosphate 1-O-acyltransferase PlsY [Planctomycetota bacterium]|nr:glycerol-3-phosphate 1-O-acyltransferase PlsY [Planctomycetota bacterium]
MEFPVAAMIPIAFACGSIPTGLLLGKLKGVDIRQHGSKNIGATNVGRVLGQKWFFICFAIDFLKAFIPVMFAGKLLGSFGTLEIRGQVAWVWLAIMVGAVLGNVLNPWLKFKGGKGVATSIGALMGVFPALTIPGAGIFVTWLVTLAIWRYISAASIAASAMLPVLTVATFAMAFKMDRISSMNPLWPFLIVTTVLATLVIFKHKANIARLRAGTEPKVGHRVAV